MSMNMNLFLQQETKELRAENERKIKKKARKHASLGIDLFLFVQEGREHVQQLDKQLNEQVDESTPVPRQRAPPRCSGRGTVGHTIRSCSSK